MKEYNIKRFVDAHQRSYNLALGEIRVGYKVSHWMWYIFLQIRGLVHSEIAEYYAIEDLDEAKAYLKEPVLVAVGDCIREGYELSGIHLREKQANNIILLN
jgi:uncharacterized protein (DUF1810 family)